MFKRIWLWWAGGQIAHLHAEAARREAQARQDIEDAKAMRAKANRMERDAKIVALDNLSLELA